MSAKPGDIVFVQLNEETSAPAIITAVDGDNVHATTFPVDQNVAHYEGPLYDTHATGHNKRDERPTWAFSAAPAPREPKKAAK